MKTPEIIREVYNGCIAEQNGDSAGLEKAFKNLNELKGDNPYFNNPLIKTNSFEFLSFAYLSLLLETEIISSQLISAGVEIKSQKDGKSKYIHYVKENKPAAPKISNLIKTLDEEYNRYCSQSTEFRAMTGISGSLFMSLYDGGKHKENIGAIEHENEIFLFYSHRDSMNPNSPNRIRFVESIAKDLGYAAATDEKIVHGMLKSENPEQDLKETVRLIRSVKNLDHHIKSEEDEEIAIRLFLKGAYNLQNFLPYVQKDESGDLSITDNMMRTIERLEKEKTIDKLFSENEIALLKRLNRLEQ